MKTQGNSPIRRMPKPVLASTRRFIELANVKPIHEDLSCLSAKEQKTVSKDLQVVANWLVTQGLNVDNLVVVLAVSEPRKLPSYVLCFESGIKPVVTMMIPGED